MSLSEVKKILSDGVESVFSFEEIWKSPVLLNKKYRTYLAPDSYAYHSVINPIFSFEVNEDFNKFSLLSLRDGLYPLARFFAINPNPRIGDPYLIIDSRLESIVPFSWREKTIVRELFTERFAEGSRELLLLISPDKDSLPLDLLELELDKISQDIERFEKVSIFMSSCNSYGEEDPEYDLAWDKKVLKTLLEKIPASKIRILDFAEYTALNVSEVNFYFLNPLLFYFSDSYLEHDLLQRGASPLFTPRKKDSNDFNVKVSINHGFVFSKLSSSLVLTPEPIVMEKIFKKTVYNASSEMGKLKLSTKEFKDWSSATARHLFAKNHL